MERCSAFFSRFFRSAAAVEPEELRPAGMAALCFFLVFGGYSLLKPVRDAMGTVYGMADIHELFTGTFFATLLLAPLYSWLLSRFKLSGFLPWVYGFVALSILAFYLLFEAPGLRQDRRLAAAFFVWVSTFNILIISVFWTFMADIFSSAQARRLFGLVAAGGTAGGIAGPLAAAFLAERVGNNNLMLISALGFMAAALLVRALAAGRCSGPAGGPAEQRLNPAGKPLDGFRLFLASPYLMWIGFFLLLMTWVSTVVYIQLGDLITAAFSSREARTRAYALIDLAVNCSALFIQFFGTSRFVARFGVGTGLLLNPVIMLFACAAVAFSPVLLVLGGIQILRRVAEYAVARPAREMLFTVTDRESRYKAKNVIDTVIYRFGDVSSAWLSSLVHPYGVGGLAVFGAGISLVWLYSARVLGLRYKALLRE